METKVKKLERWAYRILIALCVCYGVAWAADTVPFILTNTAGRPLWMVDSNGRQVFPTTSPTGAEGVTNGFVVGAANTSSYDVLFKNSAGTAVAMPDTNYRVLAVDETVSANVTPASVGIRAKSTTGFTLHADAYLTTSHTINWWVFRY